MGKKEKIMRIAIVGIGDYGGRFAARLTNSGADVTLIARGQTLERLRREGLNSTASSLTPAMRQFGDRLPMLRREVPED